MTKEKTTIERAYNLVSLLRVLSMATDGEENSATTLYHIGGSNVLDMAADMAFDILADLEKAEFAAVKS